MPISFKCEHCGKQIEAPDSAGGQRGRCPYCKQSNYIPSPVSEEEIYDLAETDEEDDKRAASEREQLREQDLSLLSEMDQPGAPAPLETKEDLEAGDIAHLIVNYCLDQADGNLERAEVHAAQLRKFGDVARGAVDDFISGKAIEAALDRIPAKALQGHLTKLREALD